MMFRKKSIEKKLNLLGKREPVKSKAVASVLCLIDPSQVPAEDVKSHLQMIFKDTQREFEFVYYLNRKSKSNSQYYPQFNRYHLHWDGDLVHPYLPELTSKKFDLMFNYFNKSNLALRALSSSVNAGFRVGFSSVDQRLNDLILASDVFLPDLFANEFPKYYSKITSHANK